MNILLSIAAFVFVSLLSLTPVSADEMNMHEPEPQGMRAKDMGMTDAQHKAIEMKAHQKYDAAVKKAEKEYAAALKGASKTKKPAATISAAKKKLQKAKTDANAIYKKEKDAGMKKAVKPAKPAMKPVQKPAVKKPAMPAKKPMMNAM